jgi:translocation and assembly module TamB
LRGRVALDVELDGSLAEPRVRGFVLLRRLRTQRGGESVDLRANVRYSPAEGELYARASGSRGQDLGLASARWQGDALRAATQPHGGAKLVASADAELFGLPLEVLPVLAEQQLKGRITGRAQLRNWGKNAELDARFEGQNLQVGTTALPGVLLSASHRADKLLAELSVKTTQGAARVKLEADANWGARAAPELKQRGVARLSTQRFELASLSPLLGAYVSELSGKLDAEAQVAVDADGTRVAGTARLEHGVVQVPAIGQRFSEISARVAVGDNQFKLQELSARGLTGRLTATGAAQLDGFALRSAELRASVAKREALPVTVEGAALGDAWGNVRVTYRSPETGERLLDVNVPEFRLTTPESGGASLQDLDNAEGIRIGTRRADGTFVTLPVQPLEPDESSGEGEASAPVQPLRIRIQLGNNVTVARGATAQAQLTGRLEVLTSPQTSVTGRIEIRGGKLDVQGKTFEIERGVITFHGSDPANPTITATARWDAPEHTVYADYVGDVETGRIKLRSEPPLSQDQLASLLLFGDPDGSRGGSDPNTAALAVSVAGETAAKGLNKALADFTSLDVRARVDTTTGSARPELALQVSPRVAAKVTRAIGEPAVGESPDRTFLTLELRLRRGWALSALLGDHGASALDLIWRHRY